jgi:hypothetical protein
MLEKVCLKIEIYIILYLGIYDPIPSTYSKELSNIIGLLLQTNPFCRPNCDFLLANEVIQRKMKELKLIVDKYDSDIKSSPIKLLNTIKMPRNVKEINQRLPKKKMHYKEFEESNLMQFDMNINKKQVSPHIDLNAKDIVVNNNPNVGESKELNSKNRDRDILINNLLNRNKEINLKEPVKENIAVPNAIIQNHRVANNNVINPMANLRVNNNNNNQIIDKYQINPVPKKDNYMMVRPSSGKKEDSRPKTPIQQSNNQKNEVRNIANNQNNYNIAPSNNLINKNKPVQLLAGLNPNPVANHQNPNPNQIRNNNLMKVEGVNLIQAKIDYGNNANNGNNVYISNPKNKDVNSRPQSANVNIQNNIKPNYPNNVMPNKIQQELNKNRVNNVNNLINYNDRAKSPNIVLRKNLNIPLSANSPRQKSPIREKYMSNNANNNVNVNKINLAQNRPIMKSPDKVHQQLKLINNNRVEIKKINYDHEKMLQNPDPKKAQNYHYVRNSNENAKGLLSKENNPKMNIRNTPLVNNNIQQYQYVLNRPASNVNNNGPKIVVINQRK